MSKKENQEERRRYIQATLDRATDKRLKLILLEREDRGEESRLFAAVEEAVIDWIEREEKRLGLKRNG